MWIFQALHLPPQKHSQTDNVLKFTEIPLRQLDAVLIHRCSDAIIPLLPLKRLSDYTGVLQTEFFSFPGDGQNLDNLRQPLGRKPAPGFFAEFCEKGDQKNVLQKTIRLHDFSAKHFVVMRHFL